MLCSGRGGLRFCKIRSRIGLLQDRPSHSFAWTSGWWPVALLCLKQGLLVHSTCSSWDLWNNAVRCFTSQFFPSSSWGLSHVDLTDGNSKSFSYRPMISTKSWLFFSHNSAMQECLCVLSHCWPSTNLLSLSAGVGAPSIPSHTLGQPWSILLPAPSSSRSPFEDSFFNPLFFKRLLCHNYSGKGLRL